MASKRWTRFLAAASLLGAAFASGSCSSDSSSNTGTGSTCTTALGCRNCPSCFDECFCRTKDGPSCVDQCNSTGGTGGAGTGGSATTGGGAGVGGTGGTGGTGGSTGGAGGTGGGGTGGVGGTGGGPQQCVSSLTGTTCEQIAFHPDPTHPCNACMQTNCCTPVNACFANNDCAGLNECLNDSCSGVPEADIQQCAQTYCGACLTSGGVPLFNAIGTCAQSSCGADCGI